MTTQIEVRPMPEGYQSDCWIVTGPIHSSEIRYYKKLTDAKRYAKELIAEFNRGSWQPSTITIEERLYDTSSRLPVLTKYTEEA